MKKSILSAILLLASVSAFAQTKTIQPSEMSRIFSYLYVTAGSKIGSCQVVVIGKIGRHGEAGTKFALQLNNASIVVEGDVTINSDDTSSFKNLVAKSALDEYRQVKELKLQWTAEAENSALTQLSITTRQYNKAGQVRVVAKESIDCAK